jgi:hypothetical protein
MNPDFILKSVRQKYFSFGSYSDVGTVDTALEFKTYYVRSKKFRFEWRDWHLCLGKEQPPNERAVWTDGKESFMRILAKDQRIKGFETALASVQNGYA